MVDCALVTGASGFSASHLVDKLRATGVNRIIGVDRLVPHSSVYDAQFELLLGGSDTTKELTELIDRYSPDWIFHLAGCLHGTAEQLLLYNSVAGAQLLEAVKTVSYPLSVVLIGSAAEYGYSNASEHAISETVRCDPDTPYGVSKFAQTQVALHYARRCGLRVSIARPFNLVGPGSPPALLAGAVLERALEAARLGRSSISIGNGESLRDFIPIEDAVAAYVDIAAQGMCGEIFNVCSGTPTRVIDVVRELLSHFGQLPEWDIRVDPSLMREDDSPCFYGDPGKLEQFMGSARSISLQDSLRASYEYAVANQG